MPRYFFHTEDGRTVRDDVGSDLPDLDAARDEGLKLLAGILPTEPIEDGPSQGLRLTIADDMQETLILIRVLVETVEADARS